VLSAAQHQESFLDVAKLIRNFTPGFRGHLNTLPVAASSVAEPRVIKAWWTVPCKLRGHNRNSLTVGATDSALIAPNWPPTSY